MDMGMQYSTIQVVSAALWRIFVAGIHGLLAILAGHCRNKKLKNDLSDSSLKVRVKEPAQSSSLNMTVRAPVN
jgi:uncharacterized membrane protein